MNQGSDLKYLFLAGQGRQFALGSLTGFNTIYDYSTMSPYYKLGLQGRHAILVYQTSVSSYFLPIILSRLSISDFQRCSSSSLHKTYRSVQSGLLILASYSRAERAYPNLWRRVSQLISLLKADISLSCQAQNSGQKDISACLKGSFYSQFSDLKPRCTKPCHIMSFIVRMRAFLLAYFLERPSPELKKKSLSASTTSLMWHLNSFVFSYFFSYSKFSYILALDIWIHVLKSWKLLKARQLKISTPSWEVGIILLTYFTTGIQGLLLQPSGSRQLNCIQLPMPECLLCQKQRGLATQFEGENIYMRPLNRILGQRQAKVRQREEKWSQASLQQSLTEQRLSKQYLRKLRKMKSFMQGFESQALELHRLQNYSAQLTRKYEHIKLRSVQLLKDLQLSKIQLDSCHQSLRASESREQVLKEQLRTERQQTVSQREELKQALRLLNTSLSEKQDIISSLQSKLRTIKQEDQKKKRLHQEQLGQLERVLTASRIQERQKYFNDDKDPLIQKNQLQRVVIRAENQFRESCAQIRMLQQKLAQKQSSLSSQARNFRILQQKLKLVEKQRDQLHTRLHKYHKELEQLTQHLNQQLQESVKHKLAWQMRVNELIVHLNESSHRQHQLQIKLVSIEKEFHFCKKELQESRSQLKQSRMQVETKNEQLVRQEILYDSLNKDVERLRLNFKQEEEHHTKLQLEIQDLQGQRARYAQKTQRYKSNCFQLKAQLGELSALYQQSKRVKNSEDALEKDQMQKEIISLKKQISKNEEDKVNFELRSLRQQNLRLMGANKKLNSNISDSSKRLVQQSSQISSLKFKLELVQKSLQAKEHQTAMLTDKIQALIVQIQRLNMRVEQVMVQKGGCQRELQECLRLLAAKDRELARDKRLSEE